MNVLALLGEKQEATLTEKRKSFLKRKRIPLHWELTFHCQ